MIRNIVVSISLGTGLMFLGMVLLLCVAIVLTSVENNSSSKHFNIYRPKTGTVGEVERSINELKYGPVNLDAAKEVKNGGFLSRLRERRQSGSCKNDQVCSSPQFAQHPAGLKATVIRPRPVVDPTDCTVGYQIVQQPSITVEPVGVPRPTKPDEYPVINPLESDLDDCPTCFNALSDLKTGAFVCSSCRKHCIGDEWHTDWNDEGLPITFLCQRCYDRMTPAQRVASYKAYVARQAKSGRSALLHQEIGN